MKKPVQSNKENQARSSQKAVKPSLKNSGLTRESERTTKNFANPDGDVVALILRDHEPIKKLIEVLKDPAIEKAGKQKSYEDFVPMLLGHAKAEEQTLYVEMKEHTDLRCESFEGDTEHAIADQLVQEINGSPDDDEWNAKVKVLAELVLHHIEEEEGKILPNVADSIDESVRLKVGARYQELKDEFDSLNLPPAFRNKNSGKSENFNLTQ